MSKRICLSVPRANSDMVTDLLHLNGFPCKVEEHPGIPTKIFVELPEEMFLPQEPEHSQDERPEPPLRLAS